MSHLPRCPVSTSPGSTSCQVLIPPPYAVPTRLLFSPPTLVTGQLTAILVPKPTDLIAISSPRWAAGLWIPWILQRPLSRGFLSSSLPLEPLSPSLFSYCSPAGHTNARIGFNGPSLNRPAFFLRWLVL